MKSSNRPKRSLRRVLASATAGAMVFALFPAGIAAAQSRGTDDVCPPPGESEADWQFDDVPQNTTHASNINCVAQYDIAQGTDVRIYSPAMNVSRAQMATYIRNFVQTATGETLPYNASQDYFGDISNTVHRNAIRALAEAGIVSGVTATEYRPSANVNRDAMATFIRNAIDYVDDGEVNGSIPPAPAAGYEFPFGDVGATNVHRNSIARLNQQGIVAGTSSTTYAPGNPVSRAAMATFIMQGADYLDSLNLWAPTAGPVDPGTPIDVEGATIALTPGQDVNPYGSVHAVTASMEDGIAADQRVRYEVYDRTNATMTFRADGTIRIVAPLIAGSSGFDSEFEYVWSTADSIWGSYQYYGENHVIVACLVETQGQSCTSDDFVEIDPVDGTLRNLVQDDWGAAEKQWQLRTANVLSASQAFDANFISEPDHQFSVDVFSQFADDVYLDFDEAGDLLGSWVVRADIFRFVADTGAYVGSSTEVATSVGSTQSPDFGTAFFNYQRDDIPLPTDVNGNIVEFDDVIVVCSDNVGAACATVGSANNRDALSITQVQEVPRSNFPTSRPGYTFVPRFPTDMLEKEWVFEDLVIVGEDNLLVPGYLHLDEDGNQIAGPDRQDGTGAATFDAFDDAVVVVPGDGTQLSWENELAPFGAVNDLAARFGSDGVVTYAAFHAEAGLAQTEGEAVTVGEIPLDGPAGTNFHIHEGAVDETGGVILSLARPTFLFAAGVGDTPGDNRNPANRETVNFDDFENDGPFVWSLDGKAQDRTAASDLSAMISATTGWDYDADETDDSVAWYYNVHSVNDSANAITPALVDGVRDNTSGEVRGQLPHGANWITPNPTFRDGYGHELPPIFQQVDVGGVRYIQDVGGGVLADRTDDVADGTLELPDATVTAVQEVHLTFNETVANRFDSPFIGAVSSDDFTVTVNGDEVEVELATDWRTARTTHTIWIDQSVTLNDIVVVTIDEDAAGDIHGWDYSTTARDLSDSVLTRAIRVGQTPDGLVGFGAITGTVTDAVSGDPVGGATVYANGAEARTDFEGNYTLLLETGTYDVWAEAAGYQDSDLVEDVAVTAYQATTVDFPLEREDSGFTGTVVDDVTSTGIGGATVRLYEESVAPGNLIGSSNTSASGEFTIGAEAGEYDDVIVVITHPSYADDTFARGDQEVEIGDFTDLGEFRLDRETGSIAGTVTIDQEDGPQDGDPVEGATVTLSRTGYPNQTTTTDVAGAYSFGDLDPGDYTVSVTALGSTETEDTAYDGDSDTTTLGASGSETVDLGLTPNVTAVSVEFTSGGGGSDTFGDAEGDLIEIFWDNDMQSRQWFSGVSIVSDNGSVVEIDCGVGITCSGGGFASSSSDSFVMEITDLAAYQGGQNIVLQNMFSRTIIDVPCTNCGYPLQRIRDVNGNAVAAFPGPIAIESS